MLPSLVLIILCGLLVQNVQGNASPQAIITISSEQLQYLFAAGMEKHDIQGRLQSLPLHETLKNGMRQQNNGGLFQIISGVVNNVLGNILGVRIKNVVLLKLDIRFDERAKCISVTVPADLDVEINLGLHLGSILRVKLFLDVQVIIRLLRNPIDGSIQLVVGNCHNNPGHLRVTVFNNRAPLFNAVNNVLRTVTNVFEQTVPHLLQKELCPLVNIAIQSVLQLLQGSLSSDVHGRVIQLTPISYVIHSGAIELDYQGAVRLPRGQTLLIPPGSNPLPQPSLDGSPMTILLSENLMNAAIRALLPPQAINLNSPQEVTVFSQTEDLRSLAPTASNIRTLQIAHGMPSLLLSVGSIQAQQAIEIKAFGDYQGRTSQFFTLGASIHMNVGITAVGGRLTITLVFRSIDNVSVISSSAQHYRANAKNLIGPITRLVSSRLLPHQNQLLTEGFQLPMAQELGVASFNVAADQDALKLSVPPNSPHVQAYAAV